MAHVAVTSGAAPAAPAQQAITSAACAYVNTDFLHTHPDSPEHMALRQTGVVST